MDSEHLLGLNESNGAVAGDGALVRKRNCELVIHITSVGEISFRFYFTIFPHLQFITGEFENFTTEEFENFTTGEFENITVQTVFPCFDFN